MSLTEKELYLSLYEKMLRIRMFEEEVMKRAKAKEGVLAIHPSTGQEATDVGIISQLAIEDLIISNHRPFGHFIAKGGSLNGLMAELYGKPTGICKGVGGEMNLSEPSIGFIQSTMIVGACLTLACGIALSQKMKEEKGITVVFFGEGASTNGAFNEALTLAKTLKLPILFVCENNGYSTNTPADDYMPTELVVHRASGYGILTNVCDGSDILAVLDAGRKAIEYVKRERKPYLLETLVARIGPHKQILVDIRPENIKRIARMRDPIPKFMNALFAENLMSSGEQLSIYEKVLNEVEEAVEFATKS